MIRTKILLCAETVLTDRETNNTSVINILDQLNIPVFPAVLPRLSAFSILERDGNDPNQSEIGLRITLASQIVFEQQLPINFDGKLRLRQTLVLGGLPLTQPGTLDFVILINGEVAHTYQILIVSTTQVTIDTQSST